MPIRPEFVGDRKLVRGNSLSRINWNDLLRACERVTEERINIWVNPRKTEWQKEFEELFEI
jgi:hypothetical protein